MSAAPVFAAQMSGVSPPEFCAFTSDSNSSKILTHLNQALVEAICNGISEFSSRSATSFGSAVTGVKKKF